MSKVTGAGAGADRLTVKLKVDAPALPSFAETSLIESVGKSSFRIVPTPWLSVTFAPITWVTFTKNDSFGSTAVSPFMTTLKV